MLWSNQAKQTPDSETLRQELLPLGGYDVYVIGSEECENTIAKSALVTSKAAWERTLRETLSDAYEMLCGHTLQVRPFCLGSTLLI